MTVMARKPFLSHEKTRHGRMVWYFKRNGKRIRMPEPYGSAEFNAAYDSAMVQTAQLTPSKLPKTTSTLRWLVGRYRKSNSYTVLASTTRRDRDYTFTRLLDKNGDKPYSAITRVAIKGYMDQCPTHNAANDFLKTMRGLFKWAVSMELLKENPCDGIQTLVVKTDGHHPWTVDEVEKYRAHHAIGTKARLAIDILLFLGLRRSDAIKAGLQHVKDGVLTMRTGKTGAWVYLTIFKQLQESIDATETGEIIFLTNRKGLPFETGDAFGHWFKRQVLAAGLPDYCTAHGLRKAGATIAADEGATAHELMAMYGWSSLEEAELYTREADKKRLARAGSELLSNRMKTKVSLTS